jgi:metal-responsive CopG/Arc/MetJ family transcriptional regulator
MTRVSKRQHVHFYLDEDIFAKMETVAQLKGTTRSELIRTACREYLIREAAKAKADSQTIQEISK